MISFGDDNGFAFENGDGFSLWSICESWSNLKISGPQQILGVQFRIICFLVCDLWQIAFSFFVAGL